MPSRLLIALLQRFRNEVHAWTLLSNGGMEIISLVGLYSTEAHPFGLVYEYSDGLDLRQYLRKNPGVGRLELVFIPAYPLPTNLLILPDNSWRG